MGIKQCISIHSFIIAYMPLYVNKEMTKGQCFMKYDKLETALGLLFDNEEHLTALINAILELGQMEFRVDPTILNNPADLQKPENYEEYKKICAIIWNYNTVTGLCAMLNKEIDSTKEAINIIDKTLAKIRKECI